MPSLEASLMFSGSACSQSSALKLSASPAALGFLHGWVLAGTSRDVGQALRARVSRVPEARCGRGPAADRKL